MSSRTSHVFLFLSLSAMAWISTTNTSAQEAAPSLYEKRLGILKGTTKGIVIWEQQASAPIAGSTTALAPAEKSGAVKADVQPPAAAAQAPATTRAWSTLPPPSGRSMADAQRLGAVGGGIPLPTARKGSPAESDSTAKP